MEHHFISKKTFRYHTSGDIEKAKQIIFVLHGYGQLAEYFIRKFTCLSDDFFIVAPEGMHRFYLKGSSGRVGASWMTKEDRLNDIKDNLFWLDELYNLIMKNATFDKVIILGFSQGGATAARWINHSNNKIDKIIQWASVYPEDLEIDFEKHIDDKIFVLGDNDEYFQGDAQKEILNKYKDKNYQCIQFTGNHDIDAECLLKIV